MTQQLLPESPEKTKQDVERHKPRSDSATLCQGGLHPIAQLQRTLGNRNMAKLIQAKRHTPEGKIIGLQRKLTAGAADDQYEQEADLVARQVLNTTNAVATASAEQAPSLAGTQNQTLQTEPLAISITPIVQRQSGNENEVEDNKDIEVEKDESLKAKFISESAALPLQRQIATDEEEAEPIQAKSAGSMSNSFEALNDVETQVSLSTGRGSPLPGPVRAYMEPRFGMDFSHVHVHTGSDALQMNQAVGAQAFTHGSDIYFGAGHSPTNSELTAHELTHVVQQTGGAPLQTKRLNEASSANTDPLIQRALKAYGVDRVQKKSDPISSQGVSINNNKKSELEADVMGAKTLEMTSAEVPSISLAQQRSMTAQRFESSEHKFMGDEGSKSAQGQTRSVELAKDYFVSFGDITAMAGDYFTDIEQMKTLAQNDGKGKGTREEIEYVRTVLVHSRKDQESRFSTGAKDAAMARYYQLAGNNAAHFTEPRGADKRTNTINNFGNYHDNHENAITMAASAGAAKQSINDAMLQEAFASHFLTDAFSSGHIRTERTSISQWWDPKVPMFWTNLKLYIAEQMAYYINDNTKIAGTFQTVQQLWETVRATLDKKNLPELKFGDFVSGAVHDYDNVKGVATQHGTLLGDAQLRDEQGNPIIDKSTGKRLTSATLTEDKAIGAVRMSIGEIEKAYELGATQSPAAVVAKLRAGGMYTVEKLWPQAKPDTDQPANRPNWKQNSVKELLADATMSEAIAIFAANKAQTLEEALTFEDKTFLGATVVSAGLQAKGFRMRITGPLKSSPISLLNTIINYTPNTGGGVGGHDTDDNALEYFQKAKAEGALSTLTQTQRIRLIRDMISGVCGDEEEQAIVDMLAACTVSDMTTVVKSLGGGNAEKGIDFLDSGIDWSEWTECKKVLRRSPELAKEL